MFDSFYIFFENSEIPMNYLSIGHDDSKNAQSWFVQKGSDDITFSKSDSGDNLRNFHLDNIQKKSFDLCGRIDHDKKQISLIDYEENNNRLNYFIKLLKMEYPNYQIVKFGHDFPRSVTFI